MPITNKPQVMNPPTRYLTAEEVIDAEISRMEDAWRALRAMLEDPEFTQAEDPKLCEMWRIFREARDRILLVKRTFRVRG